MTDRISRRGSRWALTLLTTSMLTGVAAPALAQTSGDAAQLEELVITAQKRSENLQDVPVSVTALSTQRRVLW